MCMLHMLMGHADHGGHDMSEHRTSAPQQESLLDILRRRYVMGEIRLEQFQEMQRALGLVPAATDHGQR